MDWSRAHAQPGRRPDPPAPVLARTLWTMRKASPGRSLTAAIYVVVTGRELRVHRGERVDDLIESRLSRVGDGPLEQRAGELRNILEAKGWNVGGD